MIETFDQMQRRTARDYWKAALAEAGGSVEGAARLAKKSRSCLYYHLSKSEITAVKYAVQKSRECRDWGSDKATSEFRYTM